MMTLREINEFNDCELVAQYRGGSESAFAVLLNRHKDRVFTSIYMIVKDRYVAEDLLQEAFIKAVDTIKNGKYNEEGKFLPWISRIARNLAIDHFRRNKRYPKVIMDQSSPILNSAEYAEESFEQEQIRRENDTYVRDLVKQLSQSQREVLVMRHYFRMSFQEIADATGVSINTALGRMRYALINLRKLMNKSPNAYVYKEE